MTEQDITERLRGEAEFARGCYGIDTLPDLAHEAADTIERLRAELAQTHDAANELKGYVSRYSRELAQRDAEIAAWLRDWQEERRAAVGECLDVDEIATAIESGGYREKGDG